MWLLFTLLRLKTFVLPMHFLYVSPPPKKIPDIQVNSKGNINRKHDAMKFKMKTKNISTVKEDIYKLL